LEKRGILSLAVEGLCPGHGEPILEGAGKQIRALLMDGSG